MKIFNDIFKLSYKKIKMFYWFFKDVKLGSGKAWKYVCNHLCFKKGFWEKIGGTV